MGTKHFDNAVFVGGKIGRSPEGLIWAVDTTQHMATLTLGRGGGGGLTPSGGGSHS